VSTLTPPLNQVAFSVIDLRRTERWFREGLGFAPAGGSRAFMRSPLAARVQGLPKAASTCWWLVGRNPWVQLELFQFEQPLARLLPLDHRPCDIGYSRLGVWVADFDATLEQLGRLGTRPISRPVGAAGARRACVRSPDGVYVELMEDDPLGGHAAEGRRDSPVAVRSVTISVPDLGRSTAFFRGLGLEPWSGTLHTLAHETAWGLPGARVRTQTLLAGDVLLEIAQYRDPPGKPWRPDYRISDQGLLNVAFGAHSRADHTRIYERAIAAGARPNCAPIHLPFGGVTYVNDPDGFSVEILWLRPGWPDRDWGFEPRPIQRRPSPDTHAVEARVFVKAPPAHAWRIATDHEGMAAWSGFKPVTVTQPGERERNGYGSQRTMRGPTGAVVEEVVGWEPPHSCRYRVIAGSPFVEHQGELQLEPCTGGTELTWRIRFRPRVPGTGTVLRALLERMLHDALSRKLKPLIESTRRDAIER
jgi:catechol 2,3-dioxygenase-like lactoylglutathione lyase family enzyme/uncharacterized protein YndB with AHSA1/START domain